jgi:hypothetical protein
VSQKAHNVECHLCSESIKLRVNYAESHYAECHYAECRYAYCRGAIQNHLAYTQLTNSQLAKKHLADTVFNQLSYYHVIWSEVSVSFDWQVFFKMFDQKSVHLQVR